MASCVPHFQHVQLTFLPAGDGDSLRERARPQCLSLSRSRTSSSSRPHPVCSPLSYCEICEERDIHQDRQGQVYICAVASTRCCIELVVLKRY